MDRVRPMQGILKNKSKRSSAFDYVPVEERPGHKKKVHRSVRDRLSTATEAMWVEAAKQRELRRLS